MNAIASTIGLNPVLAAGEPSGGGALDQVGIATGAALERRQRGREGAHGRRRGKELQSKGYRRRSRMLVGVSETMREIRAGTVLMRLLAVRARGPALEETA